MRKFAHRIAVFFHVHLTGVQPPKGFLQSFTSLCLLLLAGTIFYSTFEGWSYIDSLYFSVISITTVGYGDLHPTLPFTKLFTIFYIFTGMGIGIYVITTFSQSLMTGREKRLKKVGKILDTIKENNGVKS